MNDPKMPVYAERFLQFIRKWQCYGKEPGV